MKPTDSHDLADIKKKSVRGGAMSLGARLVSVVLTLVSTAVLARLLTPDDFGVLAMLLSITAFVSVFKDFGLSSAAIQKGDSLPASQASYLFWLNVAAGVVLTALVIALAPVVGWVFDNDALVAATQLISLSFLFTSLGAQHAAAIQSRLMFHKKAVADIVGTLVSFLTVMGLALLGYSFWSLVWGAISGAATTTLLLIALSPLKLARPERGQSLRQLLNFGGHVTAFEFINYFHRNLDNILIGRVWGAEALGIYSRAYQLLMFPITNLRTPINAVAFPAMSKLRGEPEKFRAYYLKISFLLALTSMPLVAFLASAADEVIGLLLGPRWLGVVPIFQALALAAFIQPVASLRGLVALSSGRSRAYLVVGAIYAVVACIAFVAGLAWGPMGVAIGYSIATYVLLYPSIKLSFQSTTIQWSDFWASIRQPALTSLFAAGAVALVLRPGMLAGMHVVFALSAKAIAFGLVWLLGNALWPGGWRALRNVRALLWQLR